MDADQIEMLRDLVRKARDLLENSPGDGHGVWEQTRDELLPQLAAVLDPEVQAALAQTDLDVELASDRAADPVHCWFGLGRANYLVVPRLALQEMPVEWQRRFVVEDAEELGMHTPSDYQVMRRSTRGRFRGDPWADYRHSTVAAARAADEEASR